MYHPKSDRAQKMLDLLKSETKADVSFMVKGQIIRSHSLIIDANAPFLSNFCNQQTDASAVIIEDTDPEVFRHILRYIYAEVVPTVDDIWDWSEELINAPNKYALVNLWLWKTSWYGSVLSTSRVCRIISSLRMLNRARY
jgi:speckle-type POZ protein